MLRLAVPAAAMAAILVPTLALGQDTVANGGTSPANAPVLSIPSASKGTLAGASSAGPIGWCFPASPMVWYSLSPETSGLVDIQVTVERGLAPWFAVNTASSQSGVFCGADNSGGAVRGNVTGSVFLQAGTDYSLIVGGNGEGFNLDVSAGPRIPTLALGRSVRQRVPRLSRYGGRSWRIDLVKGRRYRLDLALPRASRRVCANATRGLGMQIFAPDSWPGAEDPSGSGEVYASPLRRRCGSRATFRAKVSGTYLVQVGGLARRQGFAPVNLTGKASAATRTRVPPAVRYSLRASRLR